MTRTHLGQGIRLQPPSTLFDPSARITTARNSGDRSPRPTDRGQVRCARPMNKLRFHFSQSAPNAGEGCVAMSLSDRFKKVIRRAVLWYSVRNRSRKAIEILSWINDRGVKDVLFVGATGDQLASNADMVNTGIVEKQIAASYEVKMSINIEPQARISFPFLIADACDMPFPDDYVDFALANAIIEHVGQEAEQQKMVQEMSRVARSWVITTPNKYFPVESHTSTLFLHWLPAWRRKHEQEFTRLLSWREFRELIPDGAELRGMPWSPTFTAYYARSAAGAT